MINVMMNHTELLEHGFKSLQVPVVLINVNLDIMIHII